jgi:alpha/beta superfamily hydrolase
VPLADVTKLADKLALQRAIKVDFQTVPGADHFFTDRLDALKAAVDSYLAATLKEKAPA